MFIIEYLPRMTRQRDLHLNQFGWQDCNPGHSHGPAVRDHYLIHFITEGEGKFESAQKTYHLRKGQGFLICPGAVTYYEADQNKPWQYYWIGFDGIQAEEYLSQAGLSADMPIIQSIDEQAVLHYINEMTASKSMSSARELKLNGLLSLMMSQIIESSPAKKQPETACTRNELYVQKVVDFIEMNYSSKITVAQIADFVGLDRSYLGSIFKAHIHISIQEFLIRYRISRSCELMMNPILSIGDIARSVGYDDPLLFSKIFKKEQGISPKHYRSLQAKEQSTNTD